MGKRWIKWLLDFLLFLSVITGFSLLVVNSYLASNKTKILDKLPFLDNGLITFEETTISIFKDFPAATLTVKNVQVKDSLFAIHQMPVLQADLLTLNFSLAQLFGTTKTIAVQKIRLEDGALNLLTTAEGYNNLQSLLKEKEPSNEESTPSFKLLTKELDLTLVNMDLSIKDAIRNTSIIAKADHLQAQVILEEGDITANIQMALFVEELAIKIQNGSFVANSQIKGQFALTFKEDLIQIDPFDLRVNEEVFTASACIYTDKRARSKLEFTNHQTHFKETIDLLPQNIRKHLLAYQIKDAFYAKTTIKSFFKEGEVPIVAVDFRMHQNDLVVHKIPFHKTTLKGQFVNRLFEETRTETAPKNHLKVVLTELKTIQDAFHIQTDSLLITSTPKTGPRILTNARIRGTSTAISDWLENDEFFFEEGQFDLLTTVEGPLTDVNQLMINSHAHLLLTDFFVIYRPANTRFPFDHLSLKKEAGAAQFTVLNTTASEGHTVKFDGGLTNISALLVKLLNQQTASEVAIESGKLSWSNFVDLFGKHGHLRNIRPKTDAEKKMSMKETIRGIQYNFQPRLKVNIDTLEYFDLLQIANFQSGLHFEDAHTVVLEKTSFTYENGLVDFKGRLDISQDGLTPFEFELQTQHLNLQKILPAFNFFNVDLLKNIKTHPDDLSVSITHKGIIDDQKGLVPNSSTGKIVFKSEQNKIFNGTIHYEPVDTSNNSLLSLPLVTRTIIELEGDPVLFNDFFKTDQFFFEKGTFYVHLDYIGSIVSVNQLLQEAKISFHLNDGEVFYKPADVTFPLTEIDLDLEKDIANFQFLLRSDTFQQELHFDGFVENLSEILIGNTGKAFKLGADVHSPKLEWKRFSELFAATGRKEIKRDTKFETMKAAVKGILKTYDPSVDLKVDTFIYSNKLIVQDLKSSLYLKDTSTLVLDSTSFDFYEGNIELQTQFDLSQEDRTPFITHVKTEEVDLAQLLNSMDFFASKTLKSVEKLSGNITMDVNLEGIIEGKGWIADATRGSVKFDLYDLALKGLPPLDTIAAKFRLKKRLQELLFAPISSQIFINGEEITIPLMEVQSNAFNLFVEGVYSYRDQTNIWVSFPIDNLKRRADLSIIPNRRGYWITGRKIYVEVQTNEVGTNKFKLRLSKKKFYKQRHILNQYKKDKRRNRKARKVWRKRRF